VTFLEYLEKNQTAYYTALDSLDLNRLAELADRGDSAEIGRIFLHAMDAEKFRAESENNSVSAFDVDLAALIFGRPQAN
jgi:hypothetical protein